MKNVKFVPPSFVEFEEIKIPKGKHSALPYWWSYERREVLKMQYVFTASTEYDLQNGDQKDWNKLFGLSFHWWTNHRNSAMVSWRYNPVTGLIELGFYYHKNGYAVKASNQEAGEVFATIRPGQNVKTVFEVDHKKNVVKITLTTPNQTIIHQLKYTIKLNRKIRVINPWFGGNKSAPHGIYFLRKQIY